MTSADFTCCHSLTSLHLYYTSPLQPSQPARRAVPYPPLGRVVVNSRRCRVAWPSSECRARSCGRSATHRAHHATLSPCQHITGRRRRSEKTVAQGEPARGGSMSVLRRRGISRSRMQKHTCIFEHIEYHFVSTGQAMQGPPHPQRLHSPSLPLFRA